MIGKTSANSHSYWPASAVHSLRYCAVSAEKRQYWFGIEGNNRDHMITAAGINGLGRSKAMHDKP